MQYFNYLSIQIDFTSLLLYLALINVYTGSETSQLRNQ